MSADSDEADGDVFLSSKEIRKTTAGTFQVVLKGGAPWGFTLRGGVGAQSPVQIDQVNFYLFY
jgi:hypothetical protein